MRLARMLVTFATALLALSACTPDPGPRVTLGDVEVRVIVADDEEELARGLQGYDALPDGTAMLFVFGTPAPRGFAMKGVTFPIDVVFVSADLEVSAIEPLDPGDTGVVVSPGPSAYVIELPQGWA